jgi:hypothetical protein
MGGRAVGKPGVGRARLSPFYRLEAAKSSGVSAGSASGTSGSPNVSMSATRMRTSPDGSFSAGSCPAAIQRRTVRSPALSIAAASRTPTTTTGTPFVGGAKVGVDVGISGLSCHGKSVDYGYPGHSIAQRPGEGGIELQTESRCYSDARPEGSASPTYAEPVVIKYAISCQAYGPAEFPPRRRVAPRDPLPYTMILCFRDFSVTVFRRSVNRPPLPSPAPAPPRPRDHERAGRRRGWRGLGGDAGGVGRADDTRRPPQR